MAELKPCPFCGGKADLCKMERRDFPKTMYMITCNRCFAKTYLLTDKEAVINAWNRRADNG